MPSGNDTIRKLIAVLLAGMLGVQAWGLTKLVDISERVVRLETNQVHLLEMLGPSLPKKR